MEEANFNSEMHPNVAVVVQRPDGRGYGRELEPRTNAGSGPVGTSAYGYGLEERGGSRAGGIFEYWRILKRNRGTWICFSVGGAMLGVLIALPRTPVYRARTSMEVQSLNEDFLNMKQSSPVTSNDNSYETSELQTQIKILESDSLLERVAAKLDPEAKPGMQRAVKKATGWRKLLNLGPKPEMTEREWLIEKAADSLKVRPTGRTRIIEATVDSPDAQLATDFANTLASEFIEQNLEARWKTTQKTSDWLSHELGDARAKLEHSEDVLQKYAKDSGLIFTDQDTNISSEKLQQVQQELSAATADRIAKQSRKELAEHGPPDSLPDVLNDLALREAQAKITDLRRQIAELSATYTPEYSKVQRAQAQLAAMEAAFERDRTAIVARIKNDYQEASRREKLLASAYDSQTKEVTGQGEKSIQYSILKREVDSNRQLYDTMLQQLKQSSIASAMRASNVRIVDPSEIPERPFSPNFAIHAGVGLLGGLLAGITFIMLRERGDRTLQAPGEAHFWTNLPELGTIPSAAGRPMSLRHRPTKRESVELVTWDSKPSLMAEAFRTALTSILFAGEGGGPRVLVFTSASPSDGKTTVVSNLSIAMAEIRRKVLIIDADLRRPRMHNLFGVPNERGLSDLLRADDLGQLDLNSYIQETHIPGLHVLTSGAPTNAAANLLYSPNLAELLKAFQHRYDTVMVDTPPMLQMTDARVVGRLADAVILVARAEQTTRDAITAASQRFSEDRIRVMGTILNDWDPKRSPSGYYGYYKEDYYAPVTPPNTKFRQQSA